ncbi:MAG TPA: hypothetical protein VHA56_05200 [Mucilaginibacter sp.]|nr:hypothetical protein [Mucilaginibacter sp.]
MENNNKIRKYLIATHGKFAGGIKSSLELIAGEVENLFLIEAYIDNTLSIEDQISNVMSEIGEYNELIVFTDILGGSVTNQILQHTLNSDVHVVSGFNLPLLIEIIMAGTDTPIAEVIGPAIENARGQMAYVNKLLTEQNEDKDDQTDTN